MSEPTGNLINCPTYKIEDRKAILERTYRALFEDPDCRVEFKGLQQAYTKDETANWVARETIVRLLQEF